MLRTPDLVILTVTMLRPDIPLLDIQVWRAGTPNQKEWLLARAASATVTPASATVTPASATVENTRVIG